MVKKLSLFLFASLLNISNVSAQMRWNSIYQSYIDQYKNLAIEEMLRYNIPASITLAQGIFESSAGRSELTVKGNNHFGIKCHVFDCTICAFLAVVYQRFVKIRNNCAFFACGNCCLVVNHFCSIESLISQCAVFTRLLHPVHCQHRLLKQKSSGLCIAVLRFRS